MQGYPAFIPNCNGEHWILYEFARVHRKYSNKMIKGLNLKREHNDGLYPSLI